VKRTEEIREGIIAVSKYFEGGHEKRGIKLSLQPSKMLEPG
jgi:hypothetical protein